MQHYRKIPFSAAMTYLQISAMFHVSIHLSHWNKRPEEVNLLQRELDCSNADFELILYSQKTHPLRLFRNQGVHSLHRALQRFHAQVVLCPAVVVRQVIVPALRAMHQPSFSPAF